MERPFFLKYGQDQRVATVDISDHPASVQKLQTSIFHTFGIPSDGSHTLRLRYLDEDGDLITLSSNAELQEALNNLDGPIRMEFDVIPPFETQPQPATETPQAPEAQQQEQKQEQKPAQSPEALCLPSYDDLLSSELTDPSLASVSSASSSNPSASVLEPRGKGKSSEDDELPPYDNPETAPPEKTEADPLSFDNVVNEFHFHRLIIQTAVESAMQNIGNASSSSSNSSSSTSAAASETFPAKNVDSFLEYLSEITHDIGETIRRQEIAKRLAKGFEEFGDSILDFLANTFLVPHVDTITFSSSSRPDQQQEQQQQPTEATPQQQEQQQDQQQEQQQQTDNQTENENQESQERNESEESFIYVNNDQEQQERDESDSSFEFVEALTQLEGMGFWENDAMKAALVAANGDVNEALDALVNSQSQD